MTERLYYTEAYRTEFKAHVVERLTWNGRPAVVLDRTAFYPASGGQPADLGRLGGAAVADVVAREPDEAIVHILSEEISVGEIEGQVDWQRRFDHMQQHTGQHVLSAAFERELGAHTVGFHLGAESNTIDLDVTGLEVEHVRAVETVANHVVWDDRAVAVQFVDSEALADLGIQRPAGLEGPVRLVRIPASPAEAGTHFDLNPCGGTHVARTGEIGIIKVVDLEGHGDETRVSFLSGGRALRDYADKDWMIDALVNRLTVGHWELDQAVQRLQEQNKELRRTERQLRQRLLDMETEQLVEAANAHGPYRVVGRVWEGRSADELRALARKLTEHPHVVALLFSVVGRTHCCFARAENVSLDVNQLLQAACSYLGGRGGGRPRAAQGSAPAARTSELEAVLGDLLGRLEPSSRGVSTASPGRDQVPTGDTPLNAETDS